MHNLDHSVIDLCDKKNMDTSIGEKRPRPEETIKVESEIPKLLIVLKSNRYEGEYKDDQKNGRGVFTYASGDRYEGEFKDGKRNGQGVETW